MKTGKLQGPVDNIQNLKLVVNAAVNKLDIFSRSGGADPDNSNPVLVNIPDGNGNVYRTRGANVLSGTSQIVFADATAYWYRSYITTKGSDVTSIGTSTTQFDITKPAGTTARYTYDGTGISPSLSATWPRIGMVLFLNGQNFHANNKGVFVVTGSGTNYFEVTNAAVVAETNKTIGTGAVSIIMPTPVYLYAIWSAANSCIVWAASGYSGFDKVPTQTTVGFADYFLLEDGSTYTKVNTDYCVCVGKFWKTSHTSDSPDHRILSVLEYTPEVTWNPKSDYNGQFFLSSTQTAAANITNYIVSSLPVVQSGIYSITGHVYASDDAVAVYCFIWLAVGSPTAASSVYKTCGVIASGGATLSLDLSTISYMNIGEVIHLDITVNAASGNRSIQGSAAGIKHTGIEFKRID